MQDVFPLQILKDSFKTPIIKIEQIYKNKENVFYTAFTPYGEMTLVAQHHHNQEKNVSGLFELIEQRNELMKEQTAIIPLLYEQKAVKINQNYVVCMDLIEPIQIVSKQFIFKNQSQKSYQNLILSAFKISQSKFQFSSECYSLKHLIKSKISSRCYFDFTTTYRVEKEKERQVRVINFLKFKDSLIRIRSQSSKQQQKIDEIHFMKEKPCIYNFQKIIKESQNWFDLALMYNLIPNLKIHQKLTDKYKIKEVFRLTGQVKIRSSKGKQYREYLFYDGYRLDGIIELNYEKLRNQFFENEIVYIMAKDNKSISIKKKALKKEQYWHITTVDFNDMLVVDPELSKAQFINFLIAYFYYLQPITHAIKYFQKDNAILLYFTNRKKILKKTLIKFSNNYVVKDQELSIIIEKSQIQNGRLTLRKMKISDSFLLFLANCEKMLKIKEINIEECKNITENGINSLLMSPFCENLQTLNLSGLGFFDVDLLQNLNNSLKNLKINNCQITSVDQINLGALKLQSLHALGVITINKIPETVKYLSLSIGIPVENFKVFKDFQLVELKVIIIESKKKISNLLSAFYNKQNPLKNFAQGRSAKTLKNLDLSSSSVKLKDLKTLLDIKPLEKVVLEDLQSNQFQDYYFYSNVINCSLKNSKINSNQFLNLFDKSNILDYLNIVNTDIDEKSLILIVKKLKFMGTLELQQKKLYNSELLQIQNKAAEGLTIHIEKLMRDEHESILNHVLISQLQTSTKKINLIIEKQSEQVLINKIRRLLSFSSSKLTKTSNIHINNISILILLNQKSNNLMSDSFYVDQQQGKWKRVLPHLLLGQAYKQHEFSPHLQTNQFTTSLFRIVQLFPKHLIGINIKSNRLLGKQCIELIANHFSTYLKFIDFRNCLFNEIQVRYHLFACPNLIEVNRGYYTMEMDEQNFQKDSQPYLKYFVRMSHNYNKMKFKIKISNIKQTELIYSVIIMIISHHLKFIEELDLEFINIYVDTNSLALWRLIPEMSSLKVLRINIEKIQLEKYESSLLFEELCQYMGNLKVKELCVKVPDIGHQIFASQGAPRLVKQLYLSFCDSQVNESSLSKVFKQNPKIKSLELDLHNCENIVSMGKFSSIIQRMFQLQSLTINLQNCLNLKQASLYEFVVNLKKNSRLKRVQLNLTNIWVGLPELVKQIEEVTWAVKYVYFIVYVTPQKKAKANTMVPFDKLLLRGIQIVS